MFAWLATGGISAEVFSIRELSAWRSIVNKTHGDDDDDDDETDQDAV